MKQIIIPLATQPDIPDKNNAIYSKEAYRHALEVVKHDIPVTIGGINGEYMPNPRTGDHTKLSESIIGYTRSAQVGDKSITVDLIDYKERFKNDPFFIKLIDEYVYKISKYEVMAYMNYVVRSYSPYSVLARWVDVIDDIVYFGLSASILAEEFIMEMLSKK